MSPRLTPPQLPWRWSCHRILLQLQVYQDPAARCTGRELALHPEAPDRAAVAAPAHRRGCHRHKRRRRKVWSTHGEGLHYFWKGFPASGSDSDGLTASSCWFSVAEFGMCLIDFVFPYISSARLSRYRGTSRTESRKLDAVAKGFLAAKVPVFYNSIEDSGR